MTSLAGYRRSEYDFPVAAKSAARRGNRNPERRTSATRQALFLRLSTLYGGRCGAVSRLVGVLLSGRHFHPRTVRRQCSGKRFGELQSDRSLS